MRDEGGRIALKLSEVSRIWGFELDLIDSGYSQCQAASCSEHYKATGDTGNSFNILAVIRYSRRILLDKVAN